MSDTKCFISNGYLRCIVNCIFLGLGIAGAVLYSNYGIDKSTEEQSVIFVASINFLIFILSIIGECALIYKDEPVLINICGIPMFISAMNGIFSVILILCFKLPVYEIIYFSINGFVGLVVLAYYFMLFMNFIGCDITWCCECLKIFDVKLNI
jgi:hypothetical protein